MKSNAEIRREAKEMLLRGGWFGRVASALITLYLIMVLAMATVGATFAEMNVQTLADHFRAKLSAARAGLAYATPSFSAGVSMTGASVFMQLAAYLFGAIFMFGLATVLLKAVKDDQERWFASAFGGFSRPLELLWLILLINIKVFLWCLLFLVPGLVAVYRYRQAWYLKSENPEWGASKCLAESGRIMKGRKWAAFCLDLSYLWALLVYLLVFVGVGAVASVAARIAGNAAAGLLSMFATVVVMWLLIRIVVYYSAARTVFYKAVVEAAECPAES